MHIGCQLQTTGMNYETKLCTESRKITKCGANHTRKRVCCMTPHHITYIWLQEVFIISSSITTRLAMYSDFDVAMSRSLCVDRIFLYSINSTIILSDSRRFVALTGTMRVEKNWLKCEAAPGMMCDFLLTSLCLAMLSV